MLRPSNLGVLHILFNLVEVLVLADRRAVLVHDTHGLVVRGDCQDVARLERDHGELN